jgi:DNA-binding response OmpR family regulator
MRIRCSRSVTWRWTFHGPLFAPGGTALSLTPMEYRVLEYLMHRPGIVVTRNNLLEHLYDFKREKFRNVVEVYISGFRRKIDAESPTKLIHTLRRHGYVLRSRTVSSIPTREP